MGLDDMTKEWGSEAAAFKCVHVRGFRAGSGAVITPGCGPGDIAVLILTSGWDAL